MKQFEIAENKLKEMFITNKTLVLVNLMVTSKRRIQFFFMVKRRQFYAVICFLHYYKRGKNNESS